MPKCASVIRMGRFGYRGKQVRHKLRYLVLFFSSLSIGEEGEEAVKSHQYPRMGDDHLITP